MKLLSWNVNGVRAAFEKGLMDILDRGEWDVVCMQETKAHRDQIQINPKGYHQYWNSADKKGYSGTAVFSKIKPVSYTYDVGDREHDGEGRIITLEFNDFYLVNVYTPNSKRDLSRLEYRKGWDRMFLGYLKKLEKKKPVIVCGDLNVAHTELDLANPKSNKTTATRPGNAGFTDQEREDFQKYLDNGFIDTFREFSKEGGNYTWWSYMFNARAKNVGWRIDYFLISETLRPRLKGAKIHPDVMGSDHCPVSVEIR